MKHWLFAADPGTYGFEQLERDGKAVWDGIRGGQAQRYLRGIARGDRAIIYHTAPDKAAVATARITSEPYPDPKDPDGRLVVVDVEPERRYPRAVPLAELRGNPKLAGMMFLKIQRVAVSPVDVKEYDEIGRMASCIP